jgi:hypothetical protein
LHQKASAGDPAAQTELARVLLIGREAPRDLGLAMSLLHSACSHRHAPALLLHATLAGLGYGRPQSWPDALSFVAQAAERGDASARRQLAALGGVDGFQLDAWFAPRPVVRQSAAPRIGTVEAFLPARACEWLIEQSKGRLTSARVKDPTQDGSAVDNVVRTSSGLGFSSLEPDLVALLTAMRIAAATGLPLAQQEPTNILHYAPGEQYRPHYDFIMPEEEGAFASELQRYGQRVCTVLIYLNDGYEGGETEFTRLGWRFKGKAGDALIFWNLSAAGERERNSLHAGLPVTSGEKWLLSKWVRERPLPLI